MPEKSNYYIREPQKQDKEAWLNMWPDYSVEYVPKPEALEVTWERLLDEDMLEICGLFLFSTDSDELVGFLHYVLHRTTWYEGYDCYVHDVCIKPELRYKGAFGVLYDELAKQIKGREDCRTIYWHTELDNYPACAAYDKVAKRTNWVCYEHRLIDTSIKVKEVENEQN